MAEITMLRPGLWSIETPVEDFQVRGCVVAGSERAVVWDTLARPEDMHGVGDLIDSRPFSVVYSHADWDHVWGTGGLPGTWEQVIAHDDCENRMRHELPVILEEKRKTSPGCYDEVRIVPPTRTFNSVSILDLGGITLELSHLPGHTPDSVVGYIPEWRILLAGDAVETPVPFLNPGGAFEAWATALEAWAERLQEGPDPAFVIPAHGRMGGSDILLENSTYLRALLAGETPRSRDDWPLFYRQTHASNLRLVKKS